MTTALGIAEPTFSNALLDSGAVRENAGGVLGRVPAEGAPMIGFESRLAAAQDRVDFFLGFNAREPGALALGARAIRSTGNGRGAALEGLERFSHAWRASPLLRRDVEFLWLEYDGAEDGELAPPGVFLGRGTPLAPDRDRREWLELRCRDITRISGHEVPLPVRQTALACLAELPDCAGPSSVGFFLGRGHQGVRLCVAGLDPLATADYLAAVGYRGSPARFRDELEATRADVPGLLPDIGMIHLDVGPGALSSNVGVELVFEFKRQFSRWSLDPHLLRNLERRGLAEARKSAALTTWPGAYFAGRTPRRLYLRRVNHVKLVFRLDRMVEAKAYFGIRLGVPRFLRHGTPCAVEKRR